MKSGAGLPIGISTVVLGGIGNSAAVPTMTEVIMADSSYETVYGVNCPSLGRVTGLNFDEFHDGAWWSKWPNVG